jgi:hypothetical protein
MIFEYFLLDFRAPQGQNLNEIKEHQNSFP